MDASQSLGRLIPSCFESPSPSKNDASGPEQVGGAKIAAPPRLVRTYSKSFEQFPIRSWPPEALLEHLPDQAGFFVGLYVLEPIQNLPHDLQVRRPLADGAPPLEACDGTHPAIGDHFFGQEFSAGFRCGSGAWQWGLWLVLSCCRSGDAASQYVQQVAGAFRPLCRRRWVAMCLGACMG